VSPSRPRAVIRLHSSIAVRGRVVDPREQGVTGADVRLVAAPWFDDPFGLVLEAKSGSDGRFEIASIPGTAFDVAPHGVALEARAAGWPLARTSVTADSLRAGEVLLRLERGGTVRGRLVAVAGTPLAGRVVRLVDGTSQAVSGSDGRFELPLPLGGGKVLVTKPVRNFVALPAAAARGAAKFLGAFKGAGDADLGDVVLGEGQPVLGQVVDLEEKPVKAADVELRLGGVLVATTQTDDAGKFRFDEVGDEPHALRAIEPPGDNAWSGRRHADLADVRGGMPDVRVVLTGALSVFVRFLAQADRAPVVVPQVSLRATATGDTPRAYGWSWAGAGIDQVRFEVDHAGTYDVTVEIPGYEPATTTVSVLPDRESQIEVLFRKLP
jgi:hypothetical protein